MKTILLDIGGIFFYPSWRLRGMSEVSKYLQIEKETFKNALNKYKKLFYTGKISETEYWRNILKTVNIKSVSPTELKKLYRSYVQPISESLNLLPELSTQYILISCNNSPKEWMDYRINLASLDKYFSKFFTSGYLGYMKPDNEIYLKILKTYKKDNLLYLDDNEKYISIAQQKFGIESRVYHNHHDLLQLIR